MEEARNHILARLRDVRVMSAGLYKEMLPEFIAFQKDLDHAHADIAATTKRRKEHAGALIIDDSVALLRMYVEARSNAEHFFSNWV